jgi:TRAP-type mannitol/chloroaromatic compound transport system permease small subunit
LLDTLIRVLETPTRAVGVVAAWLVVPLVLVTVWEVFLRYALNAPSAWGFEFATWLTGANWVLGVAMALAAGAHVRTDVLSFAFPRRLAAAIDLLGYACLALPMLAWLALRLWEHFLAGLASGEHTGASAWNPPVWPMRLVLCVGIALLALQVAVEIIKRARMLAGRGA